MADSTEGQVLHKFHAIINQSTVIEEGSPVRHHLKVTSDESEPYKKMTIGERDANKPHKTILMVGETGSGKTKLINTMINYMLGVQREDKVWFEITDNQSDPTSAHSQTSSITVYGFYPQESPIHLTIIDTPGYGDTHNIEKDKEIAKNLHSLSESREEIDKLDAVCLVIKSTQTRLSDRQIYIFDAVQSLFGRDIAENIVLLFTHSRGAIPKNVLTAVEKTKIKCAVNEEKKPVYFLFDNCQSDAADEENDKEAKVMQEQSWDLSSREIEVFFKFLDNIKPKPLKMTQDVLQQWMQLEENISRIKHFQEIDQKQNELKQTQEALDQHKKDAEENKNFEDEVEVKEKVDIDRSKASVALCCSVCEENCHYPGSWWITLLSWRKLYTSSSLHCTVCTNKCQYSKHVIEEKIYVTKKEKQINEDLKRDYVMKVRDGETSVKKLEEELQELKEEKIKLVMEAFHCVDILQKIALNTDSLLILQHIDFLNEKMKEINEPEKAETLENIKKRAGEEKHKVVEYMKRCIKSEK